MTKGLILQTALITALLFISACSSIIEFKPRHRDAGTDDVEEDKLDEEVEGPVCGNGIREGAEECDDGRNGDPDDGCTDECAYSCRDDPDCSDGDICNGDETCNSETHRCEGGTHRDDGFVCLNDPRSICLSGECRLSECGDGFIDTGAGESCEPPDEGACSPNCKIRCDGDGDCPDDGNICNGGEYCNMGAGECDHSNIPADGTECGSGPRKICIAGTCQESICGDSYIDRGRSPSEECEDGNSVSGDGCEPATCRYSCHDSSECDDGHECTSDVCDTAVTHTCSNEIISAALCRSSAGECDAEEYCDGVNPDCPVDSYLPATAVCRPAPEECDLAENCTGSSADCPADIFQPEGTPCNDGNERTENDQCDGSGSCTGTSVGPPGLVWVSIPDGTFEMGCSPGDADCDAYEEPRHTVNVSAFRMTETEITQFQYDYMTGRNPSYFTGCPDCPVENVTWHWARAFCEDIGGRLPSEAEWEYAVRGGTTTRYYCGDDEACLNGIDWYDANSGSETHPVAEKTANAFGLYDMLGNVCEWVEDCWHSDYTGAPSTGEVWSGGDCVYRVLRGGSWHDRSRYLRASYRYRVGPDNRYSDVGFRCAQDAT